MRGEMARGTLKKRLADILYLVNYFGGVFCLVNSQASAGIQTEKLN